MRQIVWSEDALAEFREVIRYIASNNPLAAEKVARRIDETIKRLADMPTGRKGRVAGTYEKVVPRSPYIVAYALDQASPGLERLIVLRIIHGARHWPEGEWPKS